MQTFLPYPDFEASARCLDYRRLGKQRVEAFQILQVLRGEKSGWKNHPAVKMWQGNQQALAAYMNACIQEWVRRGYRNNMMILPVRRKITMPNWFGDQVFHASHRSNLLRKDPSFYGQYGWIESADMLYVWPKGDAT